MRYCGPFSPHCKARLWDAIFLLLNQHQRLAFYLALLEMPPYRNYPKLLASSVTPVQGDSIPLSSPAAIQYEVLFLADKRGDCHPRSNAMRHSVLRNVTRSLFQTVLIVCAVVTATTQTAGGAGSELQQKVAAVKQSVAGAFAIS